MDNNNINNPFPPRTYIFDSQSDVSQSPRSMLSPSLKSSIPRTTSFLNSRTFIAENEATNRNSLQPLHHYRQSPPPPPPPPPSMPPPPLTCLNETKKHQPHHHGKKHRRTQSTPIDMTQVFNRTFEPINKLLNLSNISSQQLFRDEFYDRSHNRMSDSSVCGSPVAVPGGIGRSTSYSILTDEDFTMNENNDCSNDGANNGMSNYYDEGKRYLPLDGDDDNTLNSSSIYNNMTYHHHQRSVMRKILTHLALLLFIITLSVIVIKSVTSSSSNSRPSQSILSSTLSTTSQDRQLLVIPYCNLSSRLTLMLESLTISKESNRLTILNWIKTDDHTMSYTDLFYIETSPFEQVYNNAKLPEVIDPKIFNLAISSSTRPLILSERDLPWLSSSYTNIPKSFMERQREFFNLRMWNRINEVYNSAYNTYSDTGQARSGRSSGIADNLKGSLIYAGCHEASIEDTISVRTNDYGSHGKDVSPLTSTTANVEMAMNMFSSVRCEIMNVVDDMHEGVTSRASEKKRIFVVGVCVTASNSPLAKNNGKGKGGESEGESEGEGESESEGWLKLKEELEPYLDTAILYIVSSDEAVLAWFCSNYDNVIYYKPPISKTKTLAPLPTMQTELIDLMVLGSMDYVLGDDSSYSGMGKWLASHSIIKNILKQHKRSGGCIGGIEGSIGIRELSREEDRDKKKKREFFGGKCGVDGTN